ncbi:MAG: hypothetical protein WCV88_02250 [Patescibacteria group bacterium]
MISINLYCLVRLWSERTSVISSLRVRLCWSKIIIGFIIFLPVIYTRFYDAISTAAPGNNDTYNHVVFLQDLFQVGVLNSTYYAPGFHLLFFPLQYFVNIVDIYRFVGPIIGVLFIIVCYWLIRTYIQQPLVRVLFILLCTLPVMNQLTLQTISFFPSALSFFFFIVLLELLTRPKDLTTWQRYSLFFVNGVGLALTVPYLYIQLLPIIGLAWVMMMVIRTNFEYKQRRYVLICGCLALLAFSVGIGHVFLQTKILKRGGGFPEIPIVQQQNNSFQVVSNYGTDNIMEEYNFNDNNNSNTDIGKTDVGIKKPYLFDNVLSNLQNSAFYQNNLKPMVSSAIDILNVKNIRQINNMLAVGAYLWIFISAFILWHSIKAHNLFGLFIGVSSFVFGLATQTGILEMSYYRGRCGWYLLLLAILGTVYLAQQFYKQNYVSWLIVGLVILYVGSFTNPPIFYRSYFASIFDHTYELVQRSNSSPIRFITQMNQLNIFIPNSQLLPQELTNVASDPGTSEQYLILEKKYLVVDPVLSQQAISSDKNYQQFYKQQAVLKTNFETRRQKILTDSFFQTHYRLDWSDDNVEFYRYYTPS